MRTQQVFTHYETLGGAQNEFAYCPFCGRELVARESGGKLRPTCLACGFVQYRNPAPSVSILVVDGDRVLLGRRKEEPGRGTWSVPSGYVEFDDDFLSAALKEVKEETGLAVELRCILNIVSSFLSPRFHFLGLYLVGDPLGGELVAADDLDEVAWFPVAGPLPDMGFDEDRIAIELYASGVAGLPVDPDHARRIL